MEQNADVIERRHSILLGAAVAAIISIAHAQTFRLDVWSPAALISWVGLSMLVGGVSGLAVWQFANLIPVQTHRMISVGAVALLSAMGYLLQVSVLLSVVFRMVVWE